MKPIGEECFETPDEAYILSYVCYGYAAKETQPQPRGEL